MSHEGRQDEALLLLIQERRLYEPTIVGRALGGPAPVRRLAAETLGRIGDQRGLQALLVLLRDDSAEVRRAAAYALFGQRERVVTAALALAAADPDRRTGELALRALAAGGADVERLVDAVAELQPDERFARLAAAVFTLPSEQRLLLARIGLELDRPVRAWRWALAIAHEPSAEAIEDLRAMPRHEDAGVRRAGALGLAAIGTASDLAALEPLLSDESAVVIAATLEASEGIIARGAAAPPAAWPELLLNLARSPEPERLDVRVAARRLLRYWARRQEVADALASMADDREAGLWERTAALEALLGAGSALGIDRLGDAVISRQVEWRRVAAQGIGRTPWPNEALPAVLELLERLLADDDAAVRSRAIDSIFALHEGLGDDALRRLVEPLSADLSAEVRIERLVQLSRLPIEPMERLLSDARTGLGAERDERVRRALVAAVHARARAERLERGALIAVLEQAAEDPSLPVRERAREALADLGRPEPPARTAPGDDRSGAALELLRRTDGQRRLALVTGRGTIGIELDCARARRSCLSLLQLAELGFFDGSTVSGRNVGLELTAGDPTGTGLGDAGYRLRDELTPEEFLEAGVLFLERPYPNGAGSRFVITLAPQPWRAGREIALGRVVAGFETLRSLQPGDVIVEVRVDAPGVLSGAAPPRSAKSGVGGSPLRLSEPAGR